VFAPASERVPKEPVPGHRAMIEHPDTSTPERQAAEAAETVEAAANPEPTFTRVARPSNHDSDAPTQQSTFTPTSTATTTPYVSTQTNPGLDDRWGQEPAADRRGLLMGIGLGPIVVVGSAVGVWMWLRWQRERNKPVNRLRRQARQAAHDIRDRVPSGDEVVQPAMGLLATLVSAAFVVWRQMRAQQLERAFERAGHRVSEADWQHRLVKLKQRWHPGRLELEKISISRR